MNTLGSFQEEEQLVTIYSPPSTAEDNNAWSYNFTTSNFSMSWCLGRQKCLPQLNLYD